MKLEETLNGGYGGLYGEVVTEDCYRLRKLKFVPDIIFDIGANIGIFTRFAQTLFPNVTIVAVEPHPQNCEDFKRFTPFRDDILLFQAALGSSGKVFRGTTAPNGAGESYLTPGLGFPEEDLKQTHERVPVPCLTLDDIIGQLPFLGEKQLIKIDCEGGENSIWQHPPSMEALRKIDYIAMELHDYAMGTEHSKVVEVTNTALKSLEATHDCERNGVYFWATKR